MQSEIQIENKETKPWLWKKGQSGNPAGRPKGKTLKEWSKEYLSRMTDEERDAFMEGIPKEVIWRMAEGNPTEDKNVQISVPTPILGGITQRKALQGAYTQVLSEEVSGETETETLPPMPESEA